jgi:hypothetical protein
LKPGEILRIHMPVGLGRTTVPLLSEVRWAKPEPDGFRVGLRFLS